MQRQIILDVFRQNPGEAPRRHTYTVTALPTDSVLHVLISLPDPSLVFRRGCAHGMCGTCALAIDGRPRLACKTLIQDLGPRIRLDPLPGFPILRDLMVDHKPFLADLARTGPFLDRPFPKDPAQDRQSPAELSQIQVSASCLSCGCCQAACPSTQAKGGFRGPAILNAIWRRLADSRDTKKVERRAMAGDGNGVWRCRLHGECLRHCPRGIDLPTLIQKLKRVILRG